MSATPDQTIHVDPGRVVDWRSTEPDLQIVDVREGYEHQAGHIEGDRHLALGELAAQAQTIDRGRPVVLYCRVGGRSDMAAQALRGAGFEAYSMRGGLLRWVDEGKPLDPVDGSVADH